MKKYYEKVVMRKSIYIIMVTSPHKNSICWILHRWIAITITDMQSIKVEGKIKHVVNTILRTLERITVF